MSPLPASLPASLAASLPASRSASRSAYQFVISATFTAEPIEKSIIFWSLPLKVDFTVEFSPYNQVLQTLLDPSGQMARNQLGVNVVLFRTGDLGQPERLQENLNSLSAALRVAAPRLAMPLLVVPCPGERENDLLEEFLSGIETLGNVHVLRQDWIDAHYPVAQKMSPAAEKLGQIPYTEGYFTALGTTIVRAAQSLRQSPLKVVALDCDQTLWQGVCGEDGPEGVRLTPAHRAVQDFALAQRNQGLLLTLLSKNNEADVKDTFACKTEFPLRWQHFSARRIDWQPKSQGLFSLAHELSLGIDSFVFIDDNPKEIAEVAEQAPQVIGLCLPDDTQDFAAFLQHCWCFDRLKVTREDRERAASYSQIAQFGSALEESHSLEAFYESLDLQVEIRPIADEEYPRAAQLTQRTNQFNLSTRRRNEGEMRQLTVGSLFGIHVEDRFGDYGFTGLIVIDHEPGRIRIDTLLLSCRILGRGVEHRVVSWIGHHAVISGCPIVLVPFRENARNAPAKEFLQACGIAAEMPAETLMNLRFAPIEVQLPPQNSPSLAIAESAPKIDFAYIAAELRSVAQIERARTDSAREQSSGPSRHIEDAPSTQSEEKLAAIWRDLLHRDDIAATDNFFDVGGHSLLVVLMIVKIREQFEVDLGIDEVYAADRNLAALAARIDELLHFGGVDSAEYHRIVAEVAALSESEVESRLLAVTGLHADSFSR